MFYPSKHTYLQRALCYDCGPRVINRMMDKMMKDPTTYYNLEPPFLKLKTQISNIFAPMVDATRAKKAFGNWALPKIKRQIHYPDVLVVMQALNTLLDMVYNPEKGYEAIRLGIVDRLVDMMLHEKDFIREKICMIFYVLASQEAGRRAIIRRYQILTNLFRLAEDEVDAVREKAQMAIEMVSRTLTGAVALNLADALALNLRLIGGAPKTLHDDILFQNLSTLEMLLEDNVKVLAVNLHAIDILLEKIDHPREDIAGTALSCIALICNDPQGRVEASNKGVPSLLCKKLYDERKMVQTKAANAFAFATIDSQARIKACNPCVMDRLIQLFEDFHSSELQLMAAKSLTNLAEVPRGRKFLSRKAFMKRINNVFTHGDQEIERHKQILIEVIRWKP